MDKTGTDLEEHDESCCVRKETRRKIIMQEIKKQYFCIFGLDPFAHFLKKNRNAEAEDVLS